MTKDLNKAKEWYKKAAAEGHEDAQKELDKLNGVVVEEDEDEEEEEEEEEDEEEEE